MRERIRTQPRQFPRRMRVNAGLVADPQPAPPDVIGPFYAFFTDGRNDEAPMRIQDVMTENVLTVSPGSSADDAWDLMRLKGIHHLIVTEGTRPVGVLSDRDTGGTRGRALRRGRTVAELMTVPAITVERITPVRRAANLMRGRSIGCLVVTDKGKVVGIATVSDLLELIGRGIERPVARATRWTLQHRAPHRKGHAATGVW
jgi:CBS domain-containing protein